jgi:hypothetical protein
MRETHGWTCVSPIKLIPPIPPDDAVLVIMPGRPTLVVLERLNDLRHVIEEDEDDDRVTKQRAAEVVLAVDNLNALQEIEDSPLSL